MNITSFDQIKGQEHVERAIEVAAVGHHSIDFVQNSISKDAEIVTIVERLALDEFGLSKSSFHSDLTIELSKDTYHEIFSPISVTRVVEMKKRIFKAFEFRTRIGNNTDDRCKELMKMGITRLGMTQLDIMRIIEVSKSIAALSRVAQIKPEHVSEAIQYNHRVVLEGKL